MGFFGFLRSGEFTVPHEDGFDRATHLALEDVTINNHQKPSTVRLRIKASKTDLFRKGVEIYVGLTHNELCPVRALCSYLALRGSKPGALFM